MQSSSNPAFKNMEKVISAQQQAAPSAEYLDQMYQQPAYTAPPRERFLTVDDVVTKTAVILVLAVVAGFVTAYFQAYYLALPAAIVGFVLSLIVIFKRKISPPLIIGYAIAEGIFLGAITGVFNQWYPGIAAQAIVGTLGVFGGMLVVYKTGAIRVTPRLTKMIIGGIIGVAVLMLFNLVMGLFGVNIGLRDRRHDGDRVLAHLHRAGVVQLPARLRFDRQGDQAGRAGEHVVVLRLRPDGHAGLAVPGDPAAAELHA